MCFFLILQEHIHLIISDVGARDGAGVSGDVRGDQMTVTGARGEEPAWPGRVPASVRY